MITKKTLTRQSIDELAKVCPGVTVPNRAMSTIYGCGTGSADSPFTWQEYLDFKSSGATGNFDSGHLYYYDLSGNLRSEKTAIDIPDVTVVPQTEEAKKAAADALHRKKMAQALAERFRNAGITGSLTHIEYNHESGTSGSNSGGSSSGGTTGVTGAAILGGEDCVMQCLVYIFGQLFPGLSTKGLLDKYCQEFWNEFQVNRITTSKIPKFLSKYYNTYEIRKNKGDSNTVLLNMVDFFIRQKPEGGQKYFVVITMPNPHDPTSPIDHAVVLNYVDLANGYFKCTDLKYGIMRDISVGEIWQIYGLEYLPQ